MLKMAGVNCLPIPGNSRRYRTRQALIIAGPHPDSVGVCARIENDVLLPGQLSIDIRIHSEEIPEWRRRAELAAAKAIDEFAFRGDLHLVRACDVGQRR